MAVPVQPIIQLDKINRFYGSGEAIVRACENVSLNIYSGEYCAIMGQSGSGKSTMMNILGCLDRPTSGHYFLDGLDVSKIGKQRLARIRNQKIGFIFQRYELLAGLTALENVIVPMMYAGIGIPIRRQRAIEVLKRLGLGDRLHKRPSQLSGGQQQRVAIARAIVNGPKLLLADEPTGALDTGSANEVIQIFDALHQLGITIIMVTHAPELAEYSRRIIHMSDGQVLSDRLTARKGSVETQDRP